jgi:hypothetical protein
MGKNTTFIRKCQAQFFNKVRLLSYAESHLVLRYVIKREVLRIVEIGSWDRMPTSKFFFYSDDILKFGRENNIANWFLYFSEKEKYNAFGTLKIVQIMCQILKNNLYI